MNTSRIEAFTDGVIAIIITLLVLNINLPSQPTLTALIAMHQLFLIYFVSFITLAVYWNNHHHLYQATDVITGKIMWLNIVFLLFISLFPFTTDWFGMHLYSRIPAFTYGTVVLCANVVWLLMSRAIRSEHDRNSIIGKTLISFKKSYLTIAIVCLGLVLGWFYPLSVLIACLLSLIPWVVPDRNIEKQLRKKTNLDETA